MLHACRNAHGGQFEHLLWLSCLSCQVLLVFLTLFFFNFSEFHVDSVNDCLYCISCVVCYTVEELRSRYDAKLQHVFLTFSTGIFLQKNVKIGLKNKLVEIKPSSVVKHVEISQFILPLSIETHIRRSGQYIPHIIGNLFRRHCAKNYRNQLKFD